MFEVASALDGLNEEQHQAVTHDGGPLLILAGAGTGKTRTLVARAAWLCQQGIQPSRILLLTFTRRAAEDMLSRAAPRARRPAAGSPAGPSTPSPTGSSASMPSRSPCRRSFTVIDPSDVADLLDARREEHGLVGTQRRAPRAAVCADIYTRCVNTQTTVAEVVRRGFPGVRTTQASSRSCSAAMSRTSGAMAWSTSTTCCCCGGPRCPIPVPAGPAGNVRCRAGRTSTRT